MMSAVPPLGMARALAVLALLAAVLPTAVVTAPGLRLSSTISLPFLEHVATGGLRRLARWGRAAGGAIRAPATAASGRHLGAASERARG